MFSGPNQAPMDFTSRPPRLIPDMQVLQHPCFNSLHIP